MANVVDRIGSDFSLGSFSIALGTAGLAGAWYAAQGELGGWAWIAPALYTTATALWLAFTVAYVVAAVRRRSRLREDFHHPMLGPLVAYIPVVGILVISYDGHQLWPAAARWAVVGLVGVHLLVSARLVAHWLTAELSIDHLTPVYFLPVIAGNFIAAIGLATVGFRTAATGLFGLGIFFWLVFGAIIVGRLITGPALPRQAAPLLSLLVPPPATGGIAWFLINGGRLDDIEVFLAAILGMMILVQLMLAGRYRASALSFQFWTFTFPVASTSNYAIRWSTAAGYPGWAAASWTILAAGTAAVLTIAILTGIQWIRTVAAHARPAALATVTGPVSEPDTN